MRFFLSFDAVVQLSSWIHGPVPVDAFLLEEFGDGVDVDEVDDGKDELCLSTGDAFPVGEEFAAFVLDVLFELCWRCSTTVKGEKAYPFAFGVL